MNITDSLKKSRYLIAGIEFLAIIIIIIGEIFLTFFGETLNISFSINGILSPLYIISLCLLSLTFYLYPFHMTKDLGEKFKSKQVISNYLLHWGISSFFISNIFIHERIFNFTVFIIITIILLLVIFISFGFLYKNLKFILKYDKTYSVKIHIVLALILFEIVMICIHFM